MIFKTPNIRHLRVFLEVINSKSISKASNKVFLSQPAITQAITKLEAKLNTLLFDRKNDGMYITESGKTYAYRINRALNIISEGGVKAIQAGTSNKLIKPKISSLMLTTTQLRALIAVNESQNFSLAGRNINISQSSIYRSAKELESQLGVIFFKKNKTGINTSKSAKIFAKAAKLAFVEILQGHNEVNQLHNRDLGQITVGCTPLARTSIMPNAINKFSQIFPDFSFKINDGSYNDLLNHLRYGDFDLLIGALRFPIPSDDIIQEELFSSSICLIVRLYHPLCKKNNITNNDLAKYPWITPNKNTPTYKIFKNIFKNTKFNIQNKLVTTSSQILMRSLLLESNRIGIISEEQVKYELNLGILKKIPFNIKNNSRPIGITMRKMWEPTKTQAFFIKQLKKIVI